MDGAKRIWVFFGNEDPARANVFPNSLIYTTKPEHGALKYLAAEYVDEKDYRRAKLTIQTLRAELNMLRGDSIGLYSDREIQSTRKEILPASDSTSGTHEGGGPGDQAG